MRVFIIFIQKSKDIAFKLRKSWVILREILIKTHDFDGEREIERRKEMVKNRGKLKRGGEENGEKLGLSTILSLIPCN